MVTVLEVRDLTIGYGKEPLLEEISFDVPRGEVFAILGGSGCGKSTLLRTLIGLQPPLAGRVHFRGIGPPAKAMTPPQFGVLFQSSALFGSWTLLQNVELPLRKWTRLPPDAVTAVALALDAPILFFDEPSAGLDPVTAAELDALILTLARDLSVTIVLVTHELPSILQVADQCIMLDRAAGGIIARGAPRELAERSVDPRVLAFFRRQALPRTS